MVLSRLICVAALALHVGDAAVTGLRLVSQRGSHADEPAIVAWSGLDDSNLSYYMVEGLRSDGTWDLLSAVDSTSVFAPIWEPVCAVRVGVVYGQLLSPVTGFSNAVQICNASVASSAHAKASTCSTLGNVTEVIVSRFDTQIQLEWDVHPGETVTGYSIEMKHLVSWTKVAEFVSNPLVRPDGCASQAARVQGLSPSSSYTFRVVANVDGQFRRSSAVDVKTKPLRCATSLLGEPLFDPNNAATTALFNVERAKAQLEYDAKHSEFNVVWLARVDGFLYNWDNAMHLLDEGMERFTESFRVPRHIGHRLIGRRSIDNATRWLEIARTNVQGQAATAEIFPIELRVIPLVPKSSSQFNIYYHLGLSHFLAGNYLVAAAVYEEGFHWAFTEYDEGDDAFIAMSYWLVNTYERIGTNESRQASAQLLANISSDKSRYHIVENLGWGYWYGLLLWKGEVSPEAVLQMATTKPGLELDTYGYAVAQYLYAQRSQEQQRQALQLNVILRADPQWGAFGYIGAEYDLFARGGTGARHPVVV